MEDLIPISVTIADRSLRVKVSQHEEESVRKSIKLINEKIMEFKQNYAGKDMQDYVTMALVWYATQPAGQMQTELDDSQLREELLFIGRQLDKALHQIAASN